VTFTITLARGTEIEVGDDETSVTDPMTGLEIPVRRNIALSRLLAQYENDEALRAIVANYADEGQELETAILDVVATRFVDYAFGIVLDMLGSVVGEGRQGRTDAVYQTWIKARIRANRSRGLASDLIEVLQLIGADVQAVDDVPPAGLRVAVGPATEGYLIAQYAAIANECRAGGVSLDFEYATDEDGFIFDDAVSPFVDGTTHGFDDAVAGGLGGKLGGSVLY
jgi:hypothetical protein